MLTKALGALIIIAVISLVFLWLVRDTIRESLKNGEYTKGQKIVSVIVLYLLFTWVLWGIIMTIWFGVLLIIR